MNISPALRRFFGLSFQRKVFSWGLLLLILAMLRHFLGLFFIIFIFSYIFLKLGKSIAQRILLWRHAGEKSCPVPSVSLVNWVVTVLYILFIMLVIFMLIHIIPIMIREIHELIRQAPLLVKSMNELLSQFENSLGVNWGFGIGGDVPLGRTNFGINEYITEKINVHNIEEIGRGIIQNLRNIGGVIVKIVIGLILSFIFILERNTIGKFTAKLRQSSFGFLYKEYEDLGHKIANSFGLIMEAQMIIAFVNALLTSLGLLLISFIHGGQSFPYIFILSFIVFIFGFIPVLGTFLSGFPIIVIGYGYGAATGDQFIIVSACIIMITIIHSIEAYYLNPKIVSSYMHFPIFVTFLILIVAEHFFGIPGLIIGVPMFSIIMSMLQDFDKYLTYVKGSDNTA